MIEKLSMLGNAVVDRTPEELIGAVAIAFVVALAMAGLYSVGRRKFSENLAPMISVMIFANVLSMAIGAGYLELTHKKPSLMTREPAGRPPVGPGGSTELMVEWIFREADRDRDRRISLEEATAAAASFVRRTDPSGRESMSAHALERALQSVMVHGRDPAHPPRPPGILGHAPGGFSGSRSPRDGRPPVSAAPEESELAPTTGAKETPTTIDQSRISTEASFE